MTRKLVLIVSNLHALASPVLNRFGGLEAAFDGADALSRLAGLHEPGS